MRGHNENNLALIAIKAVTHLDPDCFESHVRRLIAFHDHRVANYSAALLLGCGGSVERIRDVAKTVIADVAKGVRTVDVRRMREGVQVCQQASPCKPAKSVPWD